MEPNSLMTTPHLGCIDSSRRLKGRKRVADNRYQLGISGPYALKILDDKGLRDR